MKLHLGCGQTLLPDFVNVDNTPSLFMAQLPWFALRFLQKTSFLNGDQLGFIKTIKENKRVIQRGDVLNLRYPDNSVDVIYSSHLIGWCLSHQQLNRFISEMKRVLKPGGVIRLSFFDFNECVNDYLQHKNTIELSKSIPFGTTEFTFKEKLKFLLSPNMHGGIVLNRETIVLLLEQNGLNRIQLLKAGETTMTPEQAGTIDLSQRSENSIYVECYKAV
ncbi:MAG: class I SAM-dependent methyltransferase [Bacteroidetes bacterium]|nr:class I SAM-dependent methyltransferase [Bacteroidota bacterium]